MKKERAGMLLTQQEKGAWQTGEQHRAGEHGELGSGKPPGIQRRPELDLRAWTEEEEANMLFSR